MRVYESAGPCRADCKHCGRLWEEHASQDGFAVCPPLPEKRYEHGFTLSDLAAAQLDGAIAILDAYRPVVDDVGQVVIPANVIAAARRRIAFARWMGARVELTDAGRAALETPDDVDADLSDDTIMVGGERWERLAFESLDEL